MAKFNKDRFFNTITERVQSAINTHLINDQDYDNDDKERLHGFIQYLLVEYIEDRKFAIDVLDDFNYDDKTSWKELESVFGEFKSLMDIALVNLWKFLESQGATEYQYYHKADTSEDTPILDIAREDEKFNTEGEGDDEEEDQNANRADRFNTHPSNERRRFKFDDEENEDEE